MTTPVVTRGGTDACDVSPGAGGSVRAVIPSIKLGQYGKWMSRIPRNTLCANKRKV